MINIFKIMLSISFLICVLSIFGMAIAFGVNIIKEGVEDKEPIVIILGICLLAITNIITLGIIIAFVSG